MIDFEKASREDVTRALEEIRETMSDLYYKHKKEFDADTAHAIHIIFLSRSLGVVKHLFGMRTHLAVVREGLKFAKSLDESFKTPEEGENYEF